MSNAPPSMSVLTPDDMKQIVAQAVRTILTKVQMSRAKPSPLGLPPPNNYPITNPTPWTVFWAQDIDYFDLNLNKKAVEIKVNYSIYQNIFSFTNWIQVKGANRDASKLCKNLNTCFLGKAEIWYTEQLLRAFWVSLFEDCNSIK